MPDVLEQYEPPFDLTSDMLLAMALCPTGPLRQFFPDEPFLSLAGKTPLAMWFSRVRKICYHHQGEMGQLGGENEVLYNELNVVALLRQRALFVPGIYATSELTLRIGHHYGMPKQFDAMRFEVNSSRVTSQLQVNGQDTFVRASRFGSGRGIGRIATRLWPRRIWPARFPNDDQVRPVILGTPCVQAVHIRRGQLALGTPWLSVPVPLLPLGFYLADQQMRLPPP